MPAMGPVAAQSFEAILARQLDNLVDCIDKKILIYHQSVLSVAIEMREVTRDLGIDIKNLEERLSITTDTPAQAAVDLAPAQVGPGKQQGSASDSHQVVKHGTSKPVTSTCASESSAGGSGEKPLALKDKERQEVPGDCEDGDVSPKLNEAEDKSGNNKRASFGVQSTVGSVHERMTARNSRMTACYNERMDGDLLNIYDSTDDLEHHHKKNCLQMFKDYLMGTGFDMFIGVLILANAVVMAIELEYGGSKTAFILGIPKDTELWPAADESFQALNHIFCVTFLLEFCLRIYSLGKKFFKSPANCMDAAIVWISVLDLYIMTPLGITMPNVAFLRLLRIVKLLKALNIIKQLKPFRHLRVLVTAFVASTGALFWSVVFLMFLHFMFAILMTQLLQGYLQEDIPEDLATQLQVYKYFGTVSRSMLTMWEITMTTGAWANIGRLLIYDVDRIYTIFFILYVYLFSFGAMKVISALFLKETLAAANGDQDMMIEEKVRKKNMFLDTCRNLFHKIDANRSGFITIDELSNFMSEPAGMQWFQLMEIEPQDLVSFFCLLCEGGTSSALDFDQFIVGIRRVSGGAKSLDLIELDVAIKELINQNKQIRSDLEETKEMVKLREDNPVVLT